jgi:hypothetical protein
MSKKKKYNCEKEKVDLLQSLYLILKFFSIETKRENPFIKQLIF